MSDAYSRAAAAYVKGGKSGTDQRRMEADALLKAARQIEDVRLTWQPSRYRELDDAILFNRKLWTVFAAEVADGAERLPIDLRNNIGSLAVFIFKRSFELLANPEPERMDALIEINRQIAAGLLARPVAATPFANSDAPPPPAAA
jgi:flagellar protein FlaF